ncbi:MAG: translation initiation factor IF-2 subunit gamma [Candidatus Micrarchaeota archaeon]|nr:translation initiation factor IF-2 subunit gamma [Candidatus Micrarchaeota archaeon]MCX8154534.1 translation initiation factor IF-2 subunit gamma [Candidatus Micrarchaeota archaeon]
MEFINVGTFGHVDHGKSTLTTALTGVVTDRHSEEIKRGITIRLGHAEFVIYEKDGKYYNTKIPGAKPLKGVSIVDAPGHESLLAVAVSGIGLLDGAIFVIAANEPCPQPQTREHLYMLNYLGMKNIVIVQTKVDTVSREQALKNYQEIKQFIKGTVAENAPIIPISSTYKLNLEYLLEELVKIPQRRRDFKVRDIALVIRSFDVNKPGTEVSAMKGGVIGGAVLDGEFRVGDKIEISPGRYIEKQGVFKPITTKIVSIHRENQELEVADRNSGLVAFGTELDPSITRDDSVAGNIVSKPGHLGQPIKELRAKIDLINRDDMNNPPLVIGENIIINHLSISTIAVIKNISKKQVQIVCKKPLTMIDDNFAVFRKIQNRWRFAGMGKII